ncbi:MAG: hypothetical protein U1E56_01335 [Bauldia sp.]
MRIPPNPLPPGSRARAYAGLAAAGLGLAATFAEAISGGALGAARSWALTAPAVGFGLAVALAAWRAPALPLSPLRRVGGYAGILVMLGALWYAARLAWQGSAPWLAAEALLAAQGVAFDAAAWALEAHGMIALGYLSGLLVWFGATRIRLPAARPGAGV